LNRSTAQLETSLDLELKKIVEISVMKFRN
jgi:hypothetical protein